MAAHGSAQRRAWQRTEACMAAHKQRAWQRIGSAHGSAPVERMATYGSALAACMRRIGSAHAAHRQREGGAQVAQGQRPDSTGSIHAVSSCYTGMAH